MSPSAGSHSHQWCRLCEDSTSCVTPDPLPPRIRIIAEFDHENFIAFLITCSAVIHITTSVRFLSAPPRWVSSPDRATTRRAAVSGSVPRPARRARPAAGLARSDRAAVRAHGPGSGRPAPANTSSRPGCPASSPAQLIALQVLAALLVGRPRARPHPVLQRDRDLRPLRGRGAAAGGRPGFGTSGRPTCANCGPRWSTT